MTHSFNTFLQTIDRPLSLHSIITSPVNSVLDVQLKKAPEPKRFASSFCIFGCVTAQWQLLFRLYMLLVFFGTVISTSFTRVSLVLYCICRCSRIHMSPLIYISDTFPPLSVKDTSPSTHAIHVHIYIHTFRASGCAKMQVAPAMMAR